MDDDDKALDADWEVLEGIVDQYMDFLDRGGCHPDWEALPIRTAIKAVRYMEIIDLLRMSKNT